MVETVQDVLFKQCSMTGVHFPKLASPHLYMKTAKRLQSSTVSAHTEKLRKKKTLQGLHIVLMDDSYYDTYGPRNSRVSMLIVVLIELEVLPDSGALS